MSVICTVEKALAAQSSITQAMAADRDADGAAASCCEASPSIRESRSGARAGLKAGPEAESTSGRRPVSDSLRTGIRLSGRLDAIVRVKPDQPYRSIACTISSSRLLTLTARLAKLARLTPRLPSTSLKSFWSVVW